MHAGTWDDNNLEAKKSFVCRRAASVAAPSAERGGGGFGTVLLVLFLIGTIVGGCVYYRQYGSPCADGNIFARMQGKSLMPAGATSSTQEASFYQAPTPFAAALVEPASGA